MGVDLPPSGSAPDPFLGRTLGGRYEVLARLSVGGAGVVYQGRHVQDDRPVAIRVLGQSAAVSPQWRRRFEREARALSELKHPNVVPVSDFGIDGDAPYLVTEPLEGWTLADLINEGPVSPARALDIVGQTLRGLGFAHGKGIVHLDLTPSNIRLQALPERADHVQLLQLGMARLLDGASAPSPDENPARVFGTPSYLAPEQIKSERVDARADIYATGVILYQLLTGRPPYEADTADGVLEAHLAEPVPSLARAQPDLAIARLAQPVINRAMAKKPSDRYPHALWMLSALEAIDGGGTSVASTLKELPPVPSARRATELPTRKALPPVRNARAPRSRPWRTAIALVGLAAAVTAGATFLRGHRGPLVGSAGPVAGQGPAQDPPATQTPPAPAQPTTPTPPAATQAPPAAGQSPPPAAPQAQTKPASAGAPGRRARDPWQEAVPEALKPIRDKLASGAHVNEGALGAAYAFARQNPDDPRPWLLIGHAYAQLAWMSDSVERYQRAYRADPSCRGDPQMLEDLLKAAAHRTAGRNAARAIRDIYGAEALPALEKAIARGGGDRDANERLDHLRDSLAE